MSFHVGRVDEVVTTIYSQTAVDISQLEENYLCRFAGNYYYNMIDFVICKRQQGRETDRQIMMNA